MARHRSCAAPVALAWTCVQGELRFLAGVNYGFKLTHHALLLSDSVSVRCVLWAPLAVGIADASTDNGIVDPGVAGTCCDQEHQLLLELVALSEGGSLIV